MPKFIKRHCFISTKTKSFRLFTLAIITLFIPWTSLPLHGQVGFLPLILLSFIYLFLSRPVNYCFLKNLKKTIYLNKLLFFFIIWYVSGSIVSMFIYLPFTKIWPILLNLFTFFIGVIFAFGYINNTKTLRFFQIFLIIMLGLQAVFTIPVFISNVYLARKMYELTSGAWIHGHPGFYSIIVVLLPSIIVCAIKENVFLKLVLLVLAIAIGIMAVISSFGSPLGLIFAGVIIVGVLALITGYNIKGFLKLFFVFIFMGSFIFFGNKYISKSTLTKMSYNRVEKAFNDPKSGGYSYQYRYIGSRYYLGFKSIAPFISNPFFGAGGGTIHNNPKLGGHSSLLDMLGAFGLFGGGAVGYIGIIILMLINTGRDYFKTKNWETLLIFTTIILYTLIGITNPYWEGLGFVIVFIMAHPYRTVSRIKIRYNDLIFKLV